MTLFLTFYGEGPYWDNTVMLPAYPTGFSYARPFRYRDKWVEPSLLDRAINAPGSFVGQQAILAMRFRTGGAETQFVPLRLVELTTVAREEDNFVYFRLRQFVDFSTVTSLASAALPLPASANTRSSGRTSRKLFFEGETSTVSLASAERDAEMWGKLTELIAADRKLPVADEAKKAVFFHFHTPTRARPAPVCEIASSWSAGTQYGASFPEVSSHELVLLHRIPHLLDTNGSIQPLDVDIKTINFESAPSQVQLSANYGRSVITITGQRPSAKWEMLTIEPRAASTTSAAGETVNLVPLSIPLRSTKNLLYRLRRYWFPVLVLWLALGAQGLVGAWDTVREHRILWLAVFVSAGLASTAVVYIRRD
jgi:hypothetical protein